jgi:hypothetical protein
LVHDFPDKEPGKAISYGIYDVGRNEGRVSVGIDHDTAEFAGDSILAWWRHMGRKTYPRAAKLLIMADAGAATRKLTHCQLKTPHSPPRQNVRSFCRDLPSLGA